MKYIGTSKPIHDALGKVTGSLRYASDMQLHGMLYAALLTSPVPHAIIQAIHTEKALAVPGVVAILHCFNTTKTLFNRYRNIHGQKLINQEAIFSQQLRFVGDRVACVIAQTQEAATAALPLIELDYTELAWETDAKTVLETGMLDTMHAEGAVYPVDTINTGKKPDVTNALITETTSHFDRANHVALEAHVCIADYNNDTDELTIFSPNQSVHGLRTVLADLFALAYHKVRVVKTPMGGSFGAKQEWMAEPVAAAAALHTGRPVKLVFTREQVMLSSITRGTFDGRVKTAATKEGTVLSIEIETIVNAGAYLTNSRDYCAVISSKLFRCYSFPHSSYCGYAVCTNSPVSGAFRSWGSAELFLLLEHHFNTLAKKTQH